MCTIVALFGLVERFPLVVAANRDEFYGRNATPPMVLARSPVVVGGRDGTRGGTWMGASERGVFVAVTNQRTQALPDPTLRSRGELVLAALRAESVEAIERLLGDTNPRSVNPCNVLFGDARKLRVAYVRSDAPSVVVEALAPGISVLANDRIGSRLFPKAGRVEASARMLLEGPVEALCGGLGAALGDHNKTPIEAIEEPPEGAIFPRTVLRELSALCIHTAVYGTRSSTILALGASGIERYLFADGPPCTTPFVDVTSLFETR